MGQTIAFSDWLMEMWNDYPLLWVTGLLLVCLPTAVTLYLLCAPKRLDSAARHKKTDKFTPLDKVEEKSHGNVKKSHDNVEVSHDERKSIRTYELDVTKDDTTTENRIEVLELSGSEVTKNETSAPENGVSNGTVVTESHDLESKSHDLELKSHDQDNEEEQHEPSVEIESHDQSHDSEELPLCDDEIDPPEDFEEEIEAVVQNGTGLQNGFEEVDVVNGDLSDPSEEVGRRWSFPPVLEEFDVMDTETDPAELEAIFTDERLKEIFLDVTPDGPRLGISIVGGQGSPSGDLPVVVKRVLPDSLAEENGCLKSGDELVAMNEKLLVGVSKDVAIDALSNLEGQVRLLVLQDE